MKQKLIKKKKKKNQDGIFPVVQWLRIHLPMQETGVWSLVRDQVDPTCCGPTTEGLESSGVGVGLQPEKVCKQQWRPSTARNKQN